mgnify:CR=1 FL=1
MSIGKEFLFGVAVVLLGFLILITLGYATSAPFAILFGTFIAGIFTKDIKYGALVGLLVAFIVGLILFVIAAILFLIGVFFIITLVLAMFAQFVWSIISVVTIYHIPIIIFSPVVGAVGGFTGKIVSGPKKGKLPTSRASYAQRPVDYSNRIICPWCGTSNNVSNIYCKNCGKRLQ